MEDKAVIKKLNSLCLELEGANYHIERALLADYMYNLKEGNFKTIEDINKWLISRNWYEY